MTPGQGCITEVNQVVSDVHAIAPKLYEALLEAEHWRCDQYVTPKCAARYNRTDANGVNIGNNLINLDVLRPIRWIGLEPSVHVPGRKRKMTVYGFHSLRHSFASFCAEEGVPEATLLSILGTDSDIAAKYYTHVSEESQKRAIAAISSRSTPSSQAYVLGNHDACHLASFHHD